MADAAGSSCQSRGSRTRLTVGEIFRTYGRTYKQRHPVSPQQAKVMHALMQCRTAALGGHVYTCTRCAHETPMYNSCRDRHCPTCQNLDQARWLAERQARVLPVRHFHVVFTLPQELRAVAMAYPEPLYELLLRCAAATLVELGRDPKRLGAHLGVTAVLHTWTRELRFHPHAHCVVTAGGLAASGSPRWIHTSPDFLFPVHVMSRLFRGKFLDGLQELHRAGQLGCELTRNQPWADLRQQLYAKGWVVYAKAPFAGAEHVFQYLGRYTHRVGISNQRLLSADEQGVSFYTKNGNTCTLEPDEFMRRFLLHVLPRGFRKIRHYGLLAASNVNTKLAQARALLPTSSQPASFDPALTWQKLLDQLTGVDVSTCPACGAATLACKSIPAARAGSAKMAWDTS